MDHGDFTAACARGELRIEFEPKAAARHLSARLLLPFVTMPVLGIGVALALVGWIYTGLAVIGMGIIVPRLIKRSAPRFLYQLALHDPAMYEELTRSGVMRVTLAAETAKDDPRAARENG